MQACGPALAGNRDTIAADGGIGLPLPAAVLAQGSR